MPTYTMPEPLVLLAEKRIMDEIVDNMMDAAVEYKRKEKYRNMDYNNAW